MLSKFGMAAGVSVNYLTPNLDGLNEALAGANLPKFDNGILTYGGGGYVYVLFVRNLRIGGLGYGGSASVNRDNRSAVLGFSGGGITIEYTFPQVKVVALSLGAMLGAGKTKLDLYETDGNRSWSEIWDEYNGEMSSKQISISSSYFLFTPTLNAEILLNRFIALRLGAGYQFAFGDSWNVYENPELTDVPSDFNANGFIFNAGILVGLFVF